MFVSLKRKIIIHNPLYGPKTGGPVLHITILILGISHITIMVKSNIRISKFLVSHIKISYSPYQKFSFSIMKFYIFKYNFYHIFQMPEPLVNNETIE